MTPEQSPGEPEPDEVQPTDNSTGVPVDLERLEKVAEPADSET